MSAPNVEQFIDLLITLPAVGHEHCLAYVMSEWTKLQGEDLKYIFFFLLFFVQLRR